MWADGRDMPGGFHSIVDGVERRCKMMVDGGDLNGDISVMVVV